MLERLRLVTVLSLLLFLTLTDACRAELSPLFNPDTMLPTDQIERGMRATGKTVFQGTTISEFNLEILGVMKKAYYTQDLIMARVLDGPVVERHSGVLQGMSGSPVYIKGKVIGAIAFGPTFMREPIALIQPIDAMLRAWENESAPEQQAYEGPNRGVELAGRLVTRVTVAPTAPTAFLDEHTLAIKPLASELHCAGFSSEALQAMNKWLQPWGVEAKVGPGASAKPVPTSLEPGAAVGIQLVSGDFDINSIGTVTYREGNRVLALGHPMFRMGPVAFPMTTAWIYDFLPSFMTSQKVGSVMTPVGAMTQDTAFGAGGEIGGQCPLVPCQVRIRDEVGKLTHTYDFQVVQHDTLTPMLLVMGVTASLESGCSNGTFGMVTSTFSLEGTKGAHVTHANTNYFEGTPLIAVAEEMMAVANLFKYNLYEPQMIKSASIDATINNRDDTAMIERVYPERSTVRAGDPLDVRVVIRPWGEPPIEEKLTLNIPADMPATTLTLGVAGGAQAWNLRGALGILTPNYDSLQGVLDQFAATEQNTELLLMAASPLPGISVGGTRLPNLPVSMGALLTASEPSHLAQGVSEMLTKRQMPWVIYGGTLLQVTVEDRAGARPRVSTSSSDGGAGNDQSPEERATPSPRSAGPSPKSNVPQLLANYTRVGLENWQWPDATAGKLWWAAAAMRPDIGAKLRALRPVTDSPPLPAGPAPLPGPRGSDLGSRGTSAEEAAPADDGEETEIIRARTETRDDSEDEEEEDTQEEQGVGRVLRQPSQWTHSGASDFEGGTTESIAYGTKNGLCLLADWTTSAVTPGQTLLALAPSAKGDLYTGGVGGQIMRLRAGELEKHCEVAETMITALAVRSDGTLLAGCAPSGRMVEVSPQGQVKVLCQLPVQYIWALESADNGTYLAGTGPEGLIYRVASDGKFSLVTRLPVRHVLALAHQGKNVAAATANPGGVYQVSPQGDIHALLGTGESDVTCLAVTEDGDLYAGTAQTGQVWKVDRAGKVTKPYEDSETPVFSLLATPDGVYVGVATEGKLLLLRPDEEEVTVPLRFHALVVSRLAADAAGRAYALANVPGAVLMANLQAPRKGVYSSPVLDAERQAAWGQIDWLADIPADASLEVHCRSGNTDNPDDGSWSTWSRPYGSSDRVDMPVARYLQYRLKVASGPGSGSVRVRQVSLTYLPLNQAPVLEFKTPKVGEALRNKVQLSWDATDPDDDAMSTDLYYRAQNENEWKVLATAVNETEHTWDTTKLSAGRYEVKAILSDRRSNPVGWLEDTQVLRHLLVDNEAPLLTARRAVDKEPLGVLGTAVDAASGLVSVAWKLPDDQGNSAIWTAAVPEQNIFAPAMLNFTIPAAQLPKDATAIVVRAIDAAGNYTDVQVSLSGTKSPASEGEAEG